MSQPAHYHEAALAEARASWRLPFWQAVRDARRQRQERIANMIVPLVWDSVADWERGLAKQREVDRATYKPPIRYWINHPGELFLAKQEAKEYLVAIDRLLSIDFAP